MTRLAFAIVLASLFIIAAAAVRTSRNGDLAAPVHA